MSEPSEIDCIAVFRYHRKKWLAILNGTDELSISNEITRLLYRDLNYRTLLKCRELGRDSGRNSMLEHFVDRGFVADQVLAVRRLTERYDGRISWAVCSIPRVIFEIRQMEDIFTREAFVCVNGLPYEPTDRLSDSHLLHEVFDNLSGCEDTSNRDKNDRLRDHWYREVNRRLESSSESLRNHANKYLAHASDPSNRPAPATILFSDLDEVYKALIQAANYLSADVLYDKAHIFLPASLYDELEQLDVPYCPTEKLAELRAYREGLEDHFRDLETSM